MEVLGVHLLIVFFGIKTLIRIWYMVDVKILGLIVKLGSNHSHVPEILALSSHRVQGKLKGVTASGI